MAPDVGSVALIVAVDVDSFRTPRMYAYLSIIRTVLRNWKVVMEARRIPMAVVGL